MGSLECKEEVSERSDNSAIAEAAEGRGLGEYLLSLVYCIEEKSGTIYLRDMGNVIKVFSRTGQFLRSFSVKEFGDNIINIEIFNSKLFIQYASESESSVYEWIFCDTTGNVIKKQPRHLDKFATNWGGPYPSYHFKNMLFYYNYYTDTVFSISPDLTEYPSFIISPGEHRLPRSFLSPEQLLSNKYLKIDRIYETNDFFIIHYLYKKYKLAIVNKHNHESVVIDLKDWNNGIFSNGIKNDIDAGFHFIPKGYFVENGREYLVGLQHPYNIIKHIGSNQFINSIPKYPEKKKELEKLASGLKETDNPVLVMVRLKH